MLLGMEIKVKGYGYFKVSDKCTKLLSFQQLGKFILLPFMCKHMVFTVPSLVLEYYSYFFFLFCK